MDESEGKLKVSADLFEPESVLAFPAIPPAAEIKPWQNLSVVMMVVIGVSSVISLVLFGWIFWMLGHSRSVASDATSDPFAVTVTEPEKEPAAEPEKPPEKAVEPEKPKAKTKEKGKPKPHAVLTPTTSASPRVGPTLAVFPFEAATAKQHQQRWADHAKAPVVDTNPLGMKFSFIPAGQVSDGFSPARSRADDPVEQEHESAFVVYRGTPFGIAPAPRWSSPSRSTWACTP